ncbi:hypothetical protein FRC17_004905 [Serendipita sp. 399]|nr:hypothetical protein FRC17_004905 [Serendipita sp. 399]
MDEPGKKIGEHNTLKDSTISNWQSIPADLLYVITDLCLAAERDFDPKVLMQVCHHWNSVLMSMESLWCKILLAHPTVYANQRRMSEFEICHTPAELQKALDRTTGEIIELTCRFDSSEWAGTAGTDSSSNTPQGLIDVIRTSKSSLRIRRLRIDSDSSRLMERINFDSLEFPALEEAILVMSSSGLTKRIQVTAPRLRYLRLYEDANINLNWDLSKMTAPFTLELIGNHEAIHERFHLRKILSSVHHIVHLTLRAIRVFDGEYLTLPTLQILELVDTRLEFNLDLPSLLRLHLRESSIRTSESHPFLPPSLKTLELSNLEVENLLHIHVESLETLEFFVFHDEDMLFIRMFIEQIVKPGYVRPRKLRFQYITIDSSLLTTILHEVPDLVELFIGECELGVQFFEAFAGCSLPAGPDSSQQQPILPSLQTFKLRIHHSQPESQAESDMTNWLTWAVEARSKAGYPVKAALRATFDGGWIPVGSHLHGGRAA